MPSHTVKKGECMAQIADEHGFFWETLWNHPENAALKSRRKNPNVLLAGDRVFVPEKRQKKLARPTDERHVFRLKGVPTRFNLRVLDYAGEPRSGLRYVLSIDGEEISGEVPADGLLSHVIKASAKKARLLLKVGTSDFEEYTFDLGHLNPIDTVSGAKARLLNLGYYHGAIDESIDDDTKTAIQNFQVHAGLPATGEIDQATKGALLRRHET